MTKRATDVIGGDGKVRVVHPACSSCIFRPAGRALFRPGRCEEVVRRNLEADALLTCHETLPASGSGVAPAVCAGFWARHARDTITGRLALGFIGFTRVRPPLEEN